MCAVRGDGLCSQLYSPVVADKNAQNDRRVLSSNAIWICLNCENCIARCPKEINIPKVMDYLRERSRKERCIHKESRPVVAFHSAFLESVKRTGRLYEVGLVAGFKARTLRLTQDLNVAPVMFVKGKLNLFPERVKDENKIKRYLHKPLKRLKSSYENRFLSGMFAKRNFS